MHAVPDNSGCLCKLNHRKTKPLWVYKNRDFTRKIKLVARRCGLLTDVLGDIERLNSINLFLGAINRTMSTRPSAMREQNNRTYVYLLCFGALCPGRRPGGAAFVPRHYIDKTIRALLKRHSIIYFIHILFAPRPVLNKNVQYSIRR